MSSIQKILLFTGICIYLLSSGCEKKVSPLQKAVFKYEKRHDMDVIDDFICDGISDDSLNLEQTDNEGNNLFHWAVCNDAGRCLNSTYRLKEYAKIKQVSISHFLNASNSSSLTPIHYAVLNHLSGLIKDLLNEGVDINVTNDKSMNPLETLIITSTKSIASRFNMVLFMYSVGGRIRSEFAAQGHAFIKQAEAVVEDYPIPLKGDISTYCSNKENLISRRRKALNFLTLLLEKENKQSYLNLLPPTVFGLAFTCLHNFKTDLWLWDLNPYKS